jgi:hypothetical protein
LNHISEFDTAVLPSSIDGSSVVDVASSFDICTRGEKIDGNVILAYFRVSVKCCPSIITTKRSFDIGSRFGQQVKHLAIAVDGC